MSDDRRELADTERALNIVIEQAQTIAAERDAALAHLHTAWDSRDRISADLTAMRARAEAAEAELAENDGVIRVLRRQRGAAEAEAQRLREGIEAHRDAENIEGTLGWMADNDERLWALLAEQPEGETCPNPKDHNVT